MTSQCVSFRALLKGSTYATGDTALATCYAKHLSRQGCTQRTTSAREASETLLKFQYRGKSSSKDNEVDRSEDSFKSCRQVIAYAGVQRHTLHMRSYSSMSVMNKSGPYLARNSFLSLQPAACAKYCLHKLVRAASHNRHGLGIQQAAANTLPA